MESIKEWKKNKFVELPDGKFREPSEEELTTGYSNRKTIDKLENQIKALTKQLEKAQKQCKHPLFYDVAGYPADIRSCAICGDFLGFI